MLCGLKPKRLGESSSGRCTQKRSLGALRATHVARTDWRLLHSWLSSASLPIESSAGLWRLLFCAGMLLWARVCIFVVLACFVLDQSHAEKINYAEVRTRVSYAFGERMHEMSETLAVLQDLSKETSALLANIQAQCSAGGK